MRPTLLRSIATPFTLAAFALLTACTETPTSVVVPAVDAPSLARASAASPSIVQLALGNPQLSTLVVAIQTSDANCGTNFQSTLSGKGQFTVFAPTNAAFTALFATVPPAVALSCDVLPKVLAFHVVRGRQVAADVLDKRFLRTLGGERATVDAAAVTIAGQPIIGTDIFASNGVVHVVGGVLLPPSVTGN